MRLVRETSERDQRVKPTSETSRRMLQHRLAPLRNLEHNQFYKEAIFFRSFWFNSPNLTDAYRRTECCLNWPYRPYRIGITDCALPRSGRIRLVSIPHRFRAKQPLLLRAADRTSSSTNGPTNALTNGRRVRPGWIWKTCFMIAFLYKYTVHTECSNQNSNLRSRFHPLRFPNNPRARRPAPSAEPVTERKHDETYQTASEFFASSFSFRFG